jgi:hypothetical protein
MSRKQILQPYKLNSAAAMGATFSSNTVSVKGLDFVAFQYVWAGATTPVGTFTIEGTIDGTNWHALSGTAAVSGASGSAYQMIGTALNATTNHALCVDKVRVTYTRTSGSGPVDVWVIGKVIGA